VIFGVGTDIVEVRRIQETYERFGERFVERLLMPEERVLFEKSKWPVRFLAMRFAGKEATVKAMGTGFRNGMWIRDVGIVNNPLGRPLVIFSARGEGV
jgi:holo-[acyl-carrier protein] synthase